MNKIMSVSRRAGLLLASILVLFSSLSFTGCSNGSNDDEVNTMLVATIINTRLSRIRGKWIRNDNYTLDITETKYNDSAEYNSDEFKIIFTDDNSGYLYSKMSNSESTNNGKWFGLHFKNLSNDGKTVDIGFAGKNIDGNWKPCVDTLEEAKKELTVENGFYENYYSFTKK